MRTLLMSLFLVFLFKEHLAEKTYHRLKFSFGGKLSVHDTIVDPIEKTMVVTVGDVSDHPNVTSTTNLHDFGTGVLALKDIKGGKCYIITPMTEAFPSASDLLAQESTVVAVDNILHYTHDGIALDNTSLQTLGGSRIASFCRSYRSYSLTLKQKTKRELELDEPLSLSQIQSAPANMVTGTVYCYCNGHTINSAM